MSNVSLVGISGSPRKGGNTDFAVQYALQALGDLGLESSRFLHLGDFHLEHCRGCRACMTLGHCAIQGDDLNRIMDAVRPAEALIIGSPVFWFAPPGLFKDFMDRTHGWYKGVQQIFGGKIAAIISVATESGFVEHEAPIRTWLECYGARVVATAHLYAREKNDLRGSPGEQEKLRRLAEQVVRELSAP